VHIRTSLVRILRFLLQTRASNRRLSGMGNKKAHKKKIKVLQKNIDKFKEQFDTV
jgi:hypothetical protein